MSTKMSGLDLVLGSKKHQTVDPEVAREKISAVVSSAYEKGQREAIEEYKAERLKLSALEAQVAVLAGAAELQRCKISMAQGRCWSCHSAPAAANTYRLCEGCNH